MEKVLIHTCCAPCLLSCHDDVKSAGFDTTLFWYNPNIHPWKEYEERRDCLIKYAESENLPLVVFENYGLREFTQNVSADIDGRCDYCYKSRIEETAFFAKENGYDYFTTTLLASLYQNHEKIKAIAEEMANKYGVKFFYIDFRPNFRAGNLRAKEMDFYMQKYCGCIYSEEDRYAKKIQRDKEKYSGVL